MRLHDVFNMTEQEIFDEFICFAIELDIDYEYKEGYYLWIKSKSNICVTSHVDTVDHNHSFKDIVEKHGIIKAYRGDNQCILGSDDRAGVFIIYQLMCQLDKIPQIMLFHGEEIGGLGVHTFVDTAPDFSSIDLMISLDSSYGNRFIWYGEACTFDGLFEYIEQYGLVNDGKGIFTDITILTEYDRFVPAINIGVGYFKQHTTMEYLDVELMNLCLNKVRLLIKEAPAHFDFPKVKQKLEPMGNFFNELESNTYQRFF